MRRQTGLSLIELMISMTLGLLILAVVVAIFGSSNRTRNELEQMNRQIENGRYAMQLLNEDLQMAGYLGDYVPSTTAPATLPDPCATDIATLAANVERIISVQGYNNVTTAPSCITEAIVANTDMIVVRRAATCTIANPADANCDSSAPYLQVSGCTSDTAPAYRTDTRTGIYNLDSNLGTLTLRKVGCTTRASIRRYLTHIYFIAANNLAGDGVPTLKRAELGASGFTIVPLVAGIENLQVEYGIDDNTDGVPDRYTATPLTVADWWNTMVVRIGLLARNEEATAGYSDTKQYLLAGQTYGPFGDQYRRHAYSSIVSLANPIGRREP